MRIEVSGQFVTPQKTATIPDAAQMEGSIPRSVPSTQPKVAPIQKEGTISPPLKPAFIVMAVRISFQRKSRGLASPSSMAFSIRPVLAPI